MSSFPLTHPALALGRPPHILVVDDDPILREIAQVQLAVPGGTVTTAADGEEAWHLLQAGARVDLILTDLDMPGLDGFGLLERVRRSPAHAGLPVMVITGTADMNAVDATYAAGATAFITKPLDWQLLGYQIGSVLRAAAIEAELRAARDSARSAADAERNLLTLLQHETRTPLNAIIGRCEILRSLLEGPGGEAARAGAGQVMEAAWQLNDTLRRVFYLAQLMAGSLPLDPEVIRLSTVVEESLRLVRTRAAEAGVAIVVEAAEPAPLVACDLRAFSTALFELVGNAVTHAGPAGRVVVGWSRQEAGWAVLQVQDGGPGLQPEQVPHGNRPFGQAGDPLTREAGGLGIGLATAQRVAELHGGRLELGPAAGRGTRARLIVPEILMVPPSDRGG